MLPHRRRCRWVPLLLLPRRSLIRRQNQRRSSVQDSTLLESNRSRKLLGSPGRNRTRPRFLEWERKGGRWSDRDKTRHPRARFRAGRLRLMSTQSPSKFLLRDSLASLLKERPGREHRKDRSRALWLRDHPRQILRGRLSPNLLKRLAPLLLRLRARLKDRRTQQRNHKDRNPKDHNRRSRRVRGRCRMPLLRDCLRAT